MKIYAVGGAIRNRLLGLPVKDRDFVVLEADEAAFLRRFPMARKEGRDTPVYRVGADEYILSDAPDIAADLLGRDLTINAMAEDASGGRFCHPLALQDLEAGLLRPVRAENFLKDPLRVLRAARFAAFLPDFSPTESLLEAMSAAAPLLDRPAPERVGREVRRVLESGSPSRFFGLLAATGGLDPWFSEMEKARHVPAGPLPYHRGSVFSHLMEVTDRLAGDFLTAWMGLCHDLGKVLTPPEKWPSHHGHDRAGESLALAFGRRLRLPSRHIAAGGLACRYHMQAGMYPALRPGTRVDLLQALHRADLVGPLFRVVLADHGEAYGPMAEEDLHRMLGVRLPEEQGLTGPAAGARLRELRCLALAGRRA